MSYEGQLKNGYAESHHRLMAGLPKPEPTPEPALIVPISHRARRQLSTQIVTLKFLIELVSERESCEIAILRGDERKKSTVRARHIFCFLARNVGYGMPMIGRFLGGRDHTTIMAAVRSIESKRQTDRYLQAKLNGYQQSIPAIHTMRCSHCPYAPYLR